MTKQRNRKPSKPCVFPFRLKSGNWYNSCTIEEDDDDMFWCATETTDTGELVPGKWGHCEDSCFRTG